MKTSPSSIFVRGWTGRIGRWLAAPLQGALDWALPRRCLSCGATVATEGGLCAVCWPGVTFLTPPFGTRPLCTCCGVPLLPLESLTCAACLRNPPRFRRARAALLYDAASKPLILRFKHADRTEGARVFGHWMVRAGGEVLESVDLLVPVPLHRLRLFGRQFNQAALLAYAVGRESGVPVLPTALRRVRATGVERHRSRRERQRNLSQAIQVPPGQAQRVAGRHIAVVDDVYTSGATLEACTKALLAAGAASVQALVLARVPAPGDPGVSTTPEAMDERGR